MSLFKIKEVWSKHPDKTLEYTPSSFCSLSVGSDTFVITGSLGGSLKIFCPAKEPPNDEMTEFSIGTEIHQLSVGRFVSSSSDFQLCVLCPRSVRVYFLNFNVSENQQVSLEQAYEHSLERYSFNMVCGPFGKGNSERDFICVQSLDGFLTIFEQETIGLSCGIPEFLLPSSFMYMVTSDCFVMANFSQTLSSYKYQNFTSDYGSKSMKSEWTFICGENICDLRAVNYEYCQPSILALGDRNLYCFSDSGSLRFVKKLDCTPICFHVYASLEKDSLSFMVATSNASLLILRDRKLIWTSQLPFTPCFVATIQHNGVQSYILAADSSGKLMLGYLGTDPDLTSFVSRFDSRTTDTYEKLQSELSGVRSKISGRQLGVEQRDDSQDQIELTAEVPQSLDSPSRVRGSGVPSITVSILVTSKVVVNDIEIVAAPLPPITTVQSQLHLSTAGGGKDASRVEFTFYVQQFVTPSDLTVSVSASFKTTSGRPKVAQTSFKLPFNLCCTICEPKKTQEHKLTLDFNRTPIPVGQIFGDAFPGQVSSENPNAIAFQFFSGAIVTILTASKSNRYRFQSDDFDAIWLALNQFETLLGASNKDALGYSGQIPLQELLASVEMHSQTRLNLASISDLIQQRSNQFRVIQKRLLTKFKEKNADSLMNMDALLEGTYRQLSSLSDAAEEMEEQLKLSGCKLSSVSKIVFMLCQLIKNLGIEELKTMENAFSTALLFSNPSDQGWEEHADAAITHLLKTTMSKDSREDNTQIVTLDKHPSPEKLLRHVKMFIERVLKGASPSGESARSSSVATSSSRTPGKSYPSQKMEQSRGEASAIIEEDEEPEENGQDNEGHLPENGHLPLEQKRSNPLQQNESEIENSGYTREDDRDNARLTAPGSSSKVLNGLEHFDFSSEL